MGFTSLHSFLVISVLLYAGHRMFGFFVCLFLEDEKKKQQTNNTMLFAAESKGCFQIINIEAEENKKKK